MRAANFQHSKTLRKPIADSLISIVLPVFNEQEVLPLLLQAVEDSLQSAGCGYEIIFVNDGSSDHSGQILDDLAELNSRVRVLHFAKNFGHQAAVQAGLLHTTGDAVVIMDSDMQDSPTAIVDFIEQWQAGYDVVYAIRTDRKENFVKRWAFQTFHKTLNLIASTSIPRDAGNFGLIDRKVAIQIAQLNDRDRYFPGLRSWVGYRQIGVSVERLARYDKNPRVSFAQLCGLAKTAIFSFSFFPLTVFYIIAALSAVVCLGLISFVFYHKIFTGLAIPGWASTTITASFFGMLNALGIGILGEYVTRIYDQVRARPMFIVGSKTNFDSPEIEAPLLAKPEKAQSSAANITIDADPEFSQQS
ncbi:glycosyltransferase family 2 protein [uncultured Gimesia sp.]|jgi:polyisoprenyl-phosphate glycosyltransferase|uniref:glycosyltransferase family 2 protein n=1 Tax=uncultured Gimesia sp. TaxID=1678688 RepID=UPI0026194887|nr:glycosyltransferase family 2 protein [uncultured Gimesia sp.]